MYNIKLISLSKGFTLVELLVVIGIIGILAIALLAVLDPVEQLYKANDTAKKGVAVELLGGISRYYATKLVYPWDVPVGLGGCPYLPPAPANTPQFTDSSVETCIEVLITDGEIKSSFTSNQAMLGELYFVRTNATDPPMACFQPESKVYKSDALTIYNDHGQTGSCTLGVDCYWCAQ